MRVTEIFYSLQGEGMLAGVPSVFVRLSGCPLRCRWCDTKYAWDFSTGAAYEPSDLIEEVGQWSCRHVVITGGEPLIGPDLTSRVELADLAQRLRARGRHVTIETSGVAFVPNLACDLMSISPKLGNSTPNEPNQAADHERTRLDLNALKALIEAYDCQLKFVVEAPEDIAEIQELLRRLPPTAGGRILLMPQAATRKELLARAPRVARLCQEAGWRFGPRLQVLLWDGRRGT